MTKRLIGLTVLLLGWAGGAFGLQFLNFDLAMMFLILAAFPVLVIVIAAMTD